MKRWQSVGLGGVYLVLSCLEPAHAFRPVSKPPVRPPAVKPVPQPVAKLSGAEGGASNNTRCRSELSPDALDKAATKAAVIELFQDQPAPADPMGQLNMVAQEAIKRSSAVGATRWLQDASGFDYDQTEAGRYPTVTLNAGWYAGRTEVNDVLVSSGKTGTIGITAGASLYDGGKLKSLIQWRDDLRKASLQSVRSAKEAVVLEAISTVLERNRFRTQAQVYQQHARKMACLVEALESIVAEDRGRASELVQVRKNQAQAELARDSAVAQSRQVELKLKRLLGDQFGTGESIAGAFNAVPDLGEVHRLLEQSPEAMQLRLQADAQDDYSRSIKSGNGPQVNWSVGRSQTMTRHTDTAAWQAGISLNYVLFDARSERSAIQAALARAEASRAQYTDFIATRTERISSVHDSARTAFDRAKRYVDILRDSDLVRNYTFQQWSQLGRRSLFDLMSAEGEHFNLRIAYVNSLFDGYQASAQLRSMGGGLAPWLAPEFDQ